MIPQGNILPSSPLLSVIVPIYNTAAYLSKCLDSIIGQTYSNLEIILVDDGSPDNSGEICDEYAQKDARIRVIHQPNKGLSGARNSGLDMATGEYIAFADSDDYMKPTMYEKLISAAVKENADMVIDDFYMILESGLSRKHNGLDNSTPQTKIKDMFLRDKLPSYVWNKIYRKHLFDHIRFTKIRGFEDLLIFPHLIQKTRKIAVIHNAGYYYNCLNMGALTAVFNHNRKLNVSTKYGLFAAWKEHEKVARDMKSEAASHAENRAIKSAVSALVADTVHHTLTPEEHQTLRNYLEEKKNVKISKKHHFLHWCTRNSSTLCCLYDYGSFIWRKHKARVNKLKE